jgi:cleavage and polyadenylation specificity factor subunit 3
MSFHVSGGSGPDSVEILPLGSGSEVGRSCVVVSYMGKRIMFDCGIHPARNGLDSLPLFDDVDASTIDIVLVTHFHLDHCGALPYFCNETTFTGKVFMTHPTKAFYRMVIQDFVKVSASAHDIVTDEWLNTTMARIETIDYHQHVVHNGVRFHAYNAGHVLGAAMFFVEIAGVKILYTGDYSRTPDRHLMGAETPLVSPDILIVESTYGIQVHETREEREGKFTQWVSEVVSAPRGGKCLVPVFALGRAQELLLVLEDYWETHRDLQSVPIYFISSMSKSCTRLYTTYGNMMNDRVKHRAQNPFTFKHIILKKDLKDFVETGPCVVLASPGMLQTGVSRELFERWCGDRRNGIIIAGYCVEGTLAKQVTSRPREITKEDGQVLPLRMESVHVVSFSAHSDFKQTKEFIQSIPELKNIVLVHGNPDAAGKLSDRLISDFADRGMNVYTTINSKVIPITVTPSHHASVVGRIASNIKSGAQDTMQGILISQPDGVKTIVAREELTLYTGLPTCTLRCGVHIPMIKYHSATQVMSYLSTFFAECSLTTLDTASTIMVAKSVEITIKEADTNYSADVLQSTATLFIAWTMSSGTDCLADGICVSLLQLVSGNPTQDETDNTFRLRCAHHFLCQHYTNVVLHLSSGEITFRAVGGAEVVLSSLLHVSCEDEKVRRDVERLTRRMYLALYPLALMESEGLCECPPDLH